MGRVLRGGLLLVLGGEKWKEEGGIGNRKRKYLCTSWSGWYLVERGTRSRPWYPHKSGSEGA